MFSLAAVQADASGGEPIFLPDGSAVGQVTSGAYGYSVGQSLALGFVRADAATPGQRFSISVLGRPHEAILLDRPPFDPAGLRLRS